MPNPETRHANRSWNLGDPIVWERVPIALLMDIRDELQKLNRLLACQNFLDIPFTLHKIRLNTAKPRKTKA